MKKGSMKDVNFYRVYTTRDTPCEGGEDFFDCVKEEDAIKLVRFLEENTNDLGPWVFACSNEDKENEDKENEGSMKIELEVTEWEMQRFWNIHQMGHPLQNAAFPPPKLVWDKDRFFPLDIFGGDPLLLLTDIWNSIYWFDDYTAVKIFCAFLLKNNYKFALTSDECNPNDDTYALYTNYYFDNFKGE